MDSDNHCLGLFNADMFMDMEFTFPMDLSTGTGYLQDAIVALSNHCKRRRMSSFCNEEIDESPKNSWNSMNDEDAFAKFCNLRQNYDLAPEEDCCTMKKVVYPFEMVKPGSVEGDVTLEDINKRMVMRPTRAIRHPVGDFACRPCVTAGGLGLSGKAVVALTRIRTRGKGTVTIIKTRG